MKSILSNDKECFVCGLTQNLHRHHIFFGPNRNLSEKYGCWVYLCRKHHTEQAGVHMNRELDLRLKREAQETFEGTYTRDDFIRIFGKSYL